VGWIPGILIRAALSKTARGVIYVTASERKQMRFKQAVPWLALLLTVGLFVVAGFPQTPLPGLFVLAALAAFGGFVLCLSFGVPRLGPKAVVSEARPGTKVIAFYGVHAAFSSALAQAPPTPTIS
jgi:hypothetical protein